MSSKGIYKSGQGYWVRLMSAIGFGVIVALGSDLALEAD